MEEIQIRKIKKEDLPSVVDIHIRGWRNAYQNIIDQAYLDSLNPEEILKKREKDYQENGFIVAVKREEIVGFMCSLHCHNIANIFYHANYTMISCCI